MKVPLNVTAIAVLFASLATARDLPEPPAELRPIIPDGFRIVAFEKGDVNSDHREDYVIVIEDSPSEDSELDNWAGDRTVMIVVRDSASRLSVVARSDSIVECRRCGGNMGDPFGGILIGKGFFEISNDGGTSWRWSETYRFRYSKRDRTWYLDRYARSEFDIRDPEHAKRMDLGRKQLGHIRFEDADPRVIPEEK